MGKTWIRRALALLAFGALGAWLVGERGHLLLPSTRKWFRASGWRNLLNLSTLHFYVYGRWTSRYVRAVVRLVFPRAARYGKPSWGDHYHAKVLTHDHARALVALDHDLECRDLEQVIPYPVARDLVLQAPLELAVYECACRHARAHPCLPTQVCMVIGQPFVDFIVEHHPRGSRRISEAEALELLRAEYERGHVHTAWFKDVCLGRFYALCNCCQCCCAGIEAMVDHGIRTMASSGFVATVDEAACADCGVCVERCPFNAMRAGEGAVAVEWACCMGCGACVSGCAAEAITLVRDARTGVPLDVRALG